MFYTYLQHHDFMEYNYNEKVKEMWKDYEESHVQREITWTDNQQPQYTIICRLMNELALFKAQVEGQKTVRKEYENLSRYITIIGGILYVGARLLLLVMLFTSLRAVPLGVYENSPWTRFILNFS